MTPQKPKFVPWDLVYRVYEPESLTLKKFLVTSVRFTDVVVDWEWIQTSNRFVYDWWVNTWDSTMYDWFVWLEKNDVLEWELFETKESALLELWKAASKIQKEIKKLDL